MEKTYEKHVVHFEDIDFTVVAIPEQYRVEYEVYKITGKNNDNSCELFNNCRKRNMQKEFVPMLMNACITIGHKLNVNT